MRVSIFVVAGVHSHVCLYEILRKSRGYFELCCGQAEARIRSAHGSYIEKALSMVDSGTVIQNQPISLVPEQWKCILQLYADFYLKSKIIDINEMNMDLFFYLSVDNGFHDALKQYHGREWEYVRDHSRNMLLMKQV